MQDEFEMSMMGELSFFLGLQVKQLKEGIFIHQEKYAKDLVKKFGLQNCKKTKIPMSSSSKLDKHEGEKKVDQKLCGVLLAHFFILLFLDLTFCLVFTFVLDFNKIPKNLI